MATATTDTIQIRTAAAAVGVVFGLVPRRGPVLLAGMVAAPKRH